jgi:hypothetical protein
VAAWLFSWIRLFASATRPLGSRCPATQPFLYQLSTPTVFGTGGECAVKLGGRFRRCARASRIHSLSLEVYEISIEEGPSPAFLRFLPLWYSEKTSFGSGDSSTLIFYFLSLDLSQCCSSLFSCPSPRSSQPQPLNSPMPLRSPLRSGLKLPTASSPAASINVYGI